MSNKPLNISESAAVQMPMKTVASLIILVAMGVFAYTELTSRLVSLETSRELFTNDLLKKSEQVPVDQEQHFLLEDLYLMQSLGLRPDKKEKDRKRMIAFAQNILGVKDVNKTDSVEKIFEKSLKHLPPSSNKKQKIIKQLPKGILTKARKINPYRWKLRTTEPKIPTVGVKCPIKNSVKTSGPFRFDIKTKKWVKNTRPQYVKNEYPFRVEGTGKFCDKMPYGYNPSRNRKANTKILKSSAKIPFVGLKNKNTN